MCIIKYVTGIIKLRGYYLLWEESLLKIGSEQLGHLLRCELVKAHKKM